MPVHRVVNTVCCIAADLRSLDPLRHLYSDEGSAKQTSLTITVKQNDVAISQAVCSSDFIIAWKHLVSCILGHVPWPKTQL